MNIPLAMKCFKENRLRDSDVRHTNAFFLNKNNKTMFLLGYPILTGYMVGIKFDLTKQSK